MRDNWPANHATAIASSPSTNRLPPAGCPPASLPLHWRSLACWDVDLHHQVSHSPYNQQPPPACPPTSTLPHSSPMRFKNALSSAVVDIDLQHQTPPPASHRLEQVRASPLSYKSLGEVVRWSCGWWQGLPAKSSRTQIQSGLAHLVHVVHPPVSMISLSLQVTCLMKFPLSFFWSKI